MTLLRQESLIQDKAWLAGKKGKGLLWGEGTHKDQL